MKRGYLNKNAQHLVNKRRVYSYIRFSTPEQKLGDSARRQMEAAKEFAKKHGYEFDEQLRDEGLSGWSGTHRKKGALGLFLENVRNGKVVRGSILFVEELDRLSRETITDALDTLVFGLIRNGITIETPTGTYDSESINNGGIWRLIAKLEAAHNESQKKSDRLGSAWANKKRLARSEHKIATSRAPYWLRRVEDHFETIPEATRTVQMIYKLAGQLGRSRLVKKLNEEAPWHPPGRRKGEKGNGWRMSYVRKILTNRAVLGEYQPYTRRGSEKRIPDGEPIKNYYPAIVEPGLFNATQRRLRENKETNKGGRTGSALNLFSGLAKCAYCGGSMLYRNRGKKPKGGKYLVCESADRGYKCSLHSVRYEEIQDAILNNCIELRPEEVLPDERENVHKCDSLRLKITHVTEEIFSTEAKVKALIDQIERTESASIRDMYQLRIAEHDKRNQVLKAELDADQISLRREETTRRSFVSWKRVLGTLKSAIRPKSAIEPRLRLRSHLRDFISKIEVFGKGFAQRYDANSDADETTQKSDTFAEYFDALVDEYRMKLGPRKLVHAFINSVMEKRMSKEGRFYRIHFLPRGRVDVAPPGSLASGRELVDRKKGRREIVNPDLDRLWKEFVSNYKKGKVSAKAGK